MNLEDEINERLFSIGLIGKPRATSSKALSLLTNHYRSWLSNFLPDIDPFFRLKNSIIGFAYSTKKARVRSSFKCSHPENIYLMGQCFINYSCTFLANSLILIGENVDIGPNVGIYTIDHRLNAVTQKFTSDKRPVYIGDNSWIGGGSIILKGVKVAPMSVIGAGSVLTQSTDEGFLYAGVPAKKIKKIN
jgi:maltose O-acetyltransferase